MASSAFRENVDLLGVIRSILENYPFSAGLLREILQNSDDARATEQVFVLDCREHPTGRVWNEDIISSQGPALLAYNDASFQEEDWKALQNISRSSKKADTSKIGKFGIGIRSCYHISDFLQILSGEDLVILDPQRLFHDDGGVRLNYKEHAEKARDHFLAFRHFLPVGWNGEAFAGTVVRLPLRTHPGELREKTVAPQEIRQLFADFIRDEVRMAMLFLQNLRSIEFIIIDEHGNLDQLAKSTITVEPGLEDGTWKKLVRVNAKDTVCREEEWLLVDFRPPADEAMSKLTARAGDLSERIMKKNKLRPHVGIAFPIPCDASPMLDDQGQLFTFLRLPLATGFPGHVHAYFALTPSRQNLRNPGDSGVVKGSDDYILIQWNKLLFQEFIPRAWSQLLGALTRMYPSVGIFNAWPAPQSFSKCGESVYWKSFTNDVLEFVLQSNLAVWPLVGERGYQSLGDVLVASADIRPEALAALAGVGLNICGPLPSFLFDLICSKNEWKHRILSPESAADTLRRNFIPALTAASNEQKSGFGTILEFLLSSGDLSNIVGLPIIPTVSNQVVALYGPQTLPIHTLLDKGEYELFHPCEPNAIYVQTLPASTQRLFRQQGPSNLNIQALDSARAAEYLSAHPILHGVDTTVRPPEHVITFLAHFWLWFDGWGQRSQLIPNLANIPLLPCLHGSKPADRRKPAFESNRSVIVDPALHDYLSRLGVPFLIDEGQMGKAKEVLVKYGLVKAPEEIKPLLDCLSRSKSVTSVAPPVGVHPTKLLLKHLNAHMPKTPLQEYSEVEVETFRALPIFPIVEWSDEREGRANRRYSSVYDITAYGVDKYDVLPVLPNTVFVDTGLFNPNLLPLLNEREPAPLSEVKVLELCIKRLYQQPKILLAAILKHVAAHERDLTGALRDSLGSERFIHSANGSLKAPRDLVDSVSPLYPLYVGDQEHLPRLQDETDQQIVSHLSTIGLLDRVLSKGSVEDRIEHIAKASRFELSVQLLNILYTTGFDCKQLTLDESLAWLPALKGSLVTEAKCRPGRNQGGVHDERLFDQVLERVHTGVPTVPPSLKVKLGWDEPISFDILVKQLGLSLELVGEDRVSRVEVVTTELSKRSLEDDEWAELKQALDGRAWVPVSDARGDLLEETWRSVFSSPFVGIYQVKPALLNGRGKTFLRTLGCLDKPTLETVVRRLAQLAERPPSSAVTLWALDVLRFAVTLDLDEEGRAQLLVPDQRNQLRPIQEMVYNDVGSRALIAQLPPGQDVANSKVDDELARELRLERLGLKFVFLQSLGEDMGISPATVVKKTLEQYTEKQFLPEFLANAEDAGASRFEVILNDPSPTRGPFLSYALEKLYVGPSVMVCNDSEFTEKDFDGICRTHIGGKVDQTDSIGQFGLGALTMFHIAECAFIFSGTSMLVLDPSKIHLPIPERASLILPLKDVIDLYPGHTDCLRGLPSFDQDAKRVNGTVFFLPLRSPSHAMGRAPFRMLNYTIETFQGSILHDFQEKARESLLFIRLSHITAKRRAPAQPCKFLWSVDVQRTAVEVSGYAASRLTVSTQVSNTPRGSAKWLVVTDALSAAEIPDSVKTNGEKKSVKLGLAAPLDEEHSFHAKFFSMLPLAIPVALPVHINASFKMSSDRRQIRMDAYDNDDTRFNRWLLADQLPQLYLAQLELLALEGRKGNARWWPGVSLKTEVVVRDGNEEEDVENDMPDSLASTLIEHFYKNSLPHSTRPVCCPTYPGQALQFSEAIFYPSYSRPALSPAVKKVLDKLQPHMLVTLPIVKKNAGICGAAVAGPDFIKQLLKDGSNAKAIREQLTGDSEMSDLLRYLATPDPAHLEGLQLLQLEDRTWVTFGTTTATRPVYRWPAAGQYVRNGVFRGDQFVHLDTFPLELSNGPLGSVNVQTLTAAAVKELAEDQIDRLRADSEAMGTWVDKFWQAYPTFPPADGLPKAVETLPLVPTMGGTTFKSLLQVKNVEVLLTSGLEEEWLRDSFQDLGIPVVDQRNLAVTLTDLLRYGEYGPTEPTVFGSFLRAVSSISLSALHRLRHWPPQQQQDFAAWARRNIWSKPEKHLKTAQNLNIWRSRKGATLTLRSANDVRLLPLGVPLEVGRFCQNFVTDERSLLYLDKEPMAVEQLYGILRFDTLQAGDDEDVYRVFFQQHLLHSGAVEKPLVPNTAREMVAPDTLFEHSDFFDAAFGTTSPNFLLPSFNEFDRRLPLKRDDAVRINLFKQCAKALQDANDPNKIDRGRIVYQKYHTFLPLHIISEDKWQQLDDIRFIPRDRATTRAYLGHEIELPQHIRDLPPLISPSKVVIAKYYPVAWTQRARLEVEPEPRLAMVYPDFGRPSGEQVIAHLRELKEMSQTNRCILQDLTLTYQWLNEEDNIAKVAGLIADMRDEPIFLNVSDPSTEDWTWLPANQLALESHDLSTVRAVREYLKPFRQLLKAGGVLEAFYPPAQKVDQSARESEEQSLLKQIRRVFNEQRLAGQLTDVVFVPDSQVKSEPDEGHIPDNVNSLYSSPATVDGAVARGHRAFLAGCSPTFQAMFTGEFKEGQEATPSRPQVVKFPYPTFAIQTALDYLYTGEAFTEGTTTTLDDLLEALGLADYLAVTGLFNIVQNQIMTEKLVDPDSFHRVRERAQLLGADALASWCDEYEEGNEEFIGFYKGR